MDQLVLLERKLLALSQLADKKSREYWAMERSGEYTSIQLANKRLEIKFIKKRYQAVKGQIESLHNSWKVGAT